MEHRLNQDSYIQIEPFMVVNLKLSGNSLIIYAAIYGITVNKGVFYGSINYLAQWCNCSDRSVILCLNSLLKKGLIRKKKTSKGNVYISTPVETTLPYCENISPKSAFDDIEGEESSCDSEKSSLEGVKKVHTGGEKSSHNILINTLDKNTNLKTNIPKISKTKQKQIKCEEFLNSISETDKHNSELLTQIMLHSFQETDPSFNRQTFQLLEWQVEFAKFLISSKRSYEEVAATLNFAFHTSWISYIFKPNNFINNYEKIFRQSVTSNMWNKPSPQKQFNQPQHDLSNRIDISYMQNRG